MEVEAYDAMKSKKNRRENAILLEFPSEDPICVDGTVLNPLPEGEVGVPEEGESAGVEDPEKSWLKLNQQVY